MNRGKFEEDGAERIGQGVMKGGRSGEAKLNAPLSSKWELTLKELEKQRRRERECSRRDELGGERVGRDGRSTTIKGE